MKNKFEVGMYARYKMISYEVKISKIKEIKVYNDKITNYKDSIIYIMDDCEWVNPNTIIKASHNIIDLIEEGDYVNGYEVQHIDLEKWDVETQDIIQLQEPRIIIGNEEGCLYIEAKDIKSIVTKEQFKSLEYEVEK